MLDPVSMELSNGYLSKALDTLAKIPQYIEIGDYSVAVSRSYYAAFYSLKGLEILDNFDSKKHSGVIAYFRKEYVKTGKCESKYSNIIGKLQDAREIGDYNIVAEFNIDEAKDFYNIANDFVNEIKRVINNKVENSGK